MKKLVFLLFALCSIIVAEAQSSQDIYRNDKMMVKDLKINYQYNGMYFLKNYDSDELLFYIDDTNESIISIDNNLDISTFANISKGKRIKPIFKLNNKIYSYNYSFDSISNSTNFNLSILDNSGDTLSKHVIRNSNEDTIYYYFNNAILLKNKEILFTFYDNEPNPFDEIYSMKLIKVDTLGNVLTTKTINDTLSYFDVESIDNQIILSTFKGYDYDLYVQNNFIYYLNIETLEKEDSIQGYYANNLKIINDSILTFYGNRGLRYYYLPQIYITIENNYYIMNKNTKTIYSLAPLTNFISDNIRMEWYDYPFYFDKKGDFIDFYNPDSIYSYFYLVKEGEIFDTLLGFEIVNYKQSGDINFIYKLLYNDSVRFGEGIGEIKATNDGGVILAMRYNSRLCLAKFMPNGLLSFLNVETGEKESIKVYPNPAKDFVYVDIEATNFERGEIELYDMQGKLVKKAKLSAKQGNRVDVSNLNSGAYTYNISLNGKTISGKVIVGK